MPESDALVWLLVASQMDFPQLRFVRVLLGLSQQLFTSGEAPCCRRKHTDSIIAYRTRGREGGEGEHGELGGGGTKQKQIKMCFPNLRHRFDLVAIVNLLKDLQEQHLFSDHPQLGLLLLLLGVLLLLLLLH